MIFSLLFSLGSKTFRNNIMPAENASSSSLVESTCTVVLFLLALNIPEPVGEFTLPPHCSAYIFFIRCSLPPLPSGVFLISLDLPRLIPTHIRPTYHTPLIGKTL